MSFYQRMFYHRDGTPYPPDEQEGLLAWAEDQKNRELVVVRQDKLTDGTFVSTIWMGLDMDHFSIITDAPHLPLIFETMVWDAQDEIIDQKRWRTEDDAIAGHYEVLEAQQKRVSDAGD